MDAVKNGKGLLKGKMKKKNILITLLVLMFLLDASIVSYASGREWVNQADSLETHFRHIISTEDISQVFGSARGRVLSSAGLQISDEGQGVLGVYAETLCHTSVKQIYMTIYLDVWDEERQDWVTLDLYDYEWKASDNPDRNLTDVSVSFELEGLPRGRTYSLRGTHIAKNFDNITEVMSSETSGIVLD